MTYSKNPSMRRRVALLVPALGLSGLAVLATQTASTALAGPGVTSLQLPVPAGGINPRINAVSCGSPGVCMAVGSYTGGSTLHGLIETLSGGHWTASEGPVPQGGTGASGLGEVSCTGTSTCVVSGGYSTAPYVTTPMAAVWYGGHWKVAGMAPPSGGVFPSGVNDAPIAGVGCFGPSACAVAGNYFDSGNAHRGWTAVFSGGAWQAARKITPPPDASSLNGQSVSGLSCGGGLCQAVGAYANSDGFQSLEATVNADGSTNAPFAGHLPGTANQAADGLLGVSCSTGGSCVGYGTYRTVGGSYTQSYLVGIGGSGFQAQQPPTPTSQSTTAFPAVRLAAASCDGGGCVVVGSYVDSGSNYHPLLDRLVNGHWTPDIAPGPAYPNTVACGGPTFCVAADASSSSNPADVFTGSTWTTVPIRLPDGTTSGYSIWSQPVACDTSSSCWMVGQYGSAIFADHFTSSSSSGGSTGVTTAQVASWFHGAIVPGGAAARIGNLLRTHGLNTTFNVARAGTLKVTWTSSKGVIATVTKKFLRSGRFGVKIGLTTLGLHLLPKVSRLSIKTMASFTVSGHGAVVARGQVTLRR